MNRSGKRIMGAKAGAVPREYFKGKKKHQQDNTEKMKKKQRETVHIRELILFVCGFYLTLLI